MFRSGFTTLIISNEELNDIKIVTFLEKSRLIIKGVSETNKNEVKQQKWGFLGMVSATYSAIHNQMFGSGSTTLWFLMKNWISWKYTNHLKNLGY